MKKSNFKQIFLTLALLITAATGAWAAEEETLLTTLTFGGSSTYSETTSGVVTVTATSVSEYNAEYGWTFGAGNSLSVTAKEGYTITKCIFKQNEKPSLEDDKSPFVLNITTDGVYIYASVESSSGVKTSNGDDFMDGVTSIEVYGYAPTPLMTLNPTNTVATMEMPASDVTVEYSLVRDLTQQVTFGGIPTGDGLVVKNNGTAYEFVTTPDITLIDGLAATDAQNITSAEGITLTTQKKGDGETWQTLDETALAAGFAPGTYRLVATANADGPYDGTIYSAAFTTVEKYDLLIQPADEYSKDKLSEVTVAGAAQTLDADGKATVPNVAPGDEVKLKANRGYVIEKVEAKKPAEAPVENATVIWQGNVLIDWNNPKVEGAESAMSSLAYGGYDWSTVSAGTTLKIHYTLYTGKDYWNLRLGNGAWSALPGTADINLAEGSSLYSIVLTQDMLDELVANGGLAITGAFIYVTKVELVN